MLDVHAPDHSIHGVRDFFLHLLTITAGLLIALGLEATVEAVHHRHQRREAEAMIRHEIQENLKDLKESAPGAVEELNKMTRVLHTLEGRIQGQPGVLHEEDFGFHEAPIQDAAWRTASSTGVLSYMEYSQVERFSAAYKEQQLLQTMEEQALEDYLEVEPVLSHHGSELSVETAKEALPYVRRTVAHLTGMLAVGAGTVQTYESALKE